MDSPNEFTIKQPRWLLIFSLIIGTISIVAIVTAISLMAFGKIDPDSAGGGIIALSCLFLFMAALGIYSYFYDVFVYRNGIFFCKKAFHKTKQIPVDTIYSAVAIGIKVISFKDKNGECILRVTDAYMLLENEAFKNVLVYYDIPLITLPKL